MPSECGKCGTDDCLFNGYTGSIVVSVEYIAIATKEHYRCLGIGVFSSYAGFNESYYFSNLANGYLIGTFPVRNTLYFNYATT